MRPLRSSWTRRAVSRRSSFPGWRTQKRSDFNPSYIDEKRVRKDLQEVVLRREVPRKALVRRRQAGGEEGEVLHTLLVDRDPTAQGQFLPFTPPPSPVEYS